MGKAIAIVSMFPIGVGVSLSNWVKVAVRSLKQNTQIKVQLTPMGTILEADNIETILEGIKKAHQDLEATGVQRISTTLKIDYRVDKERVMNDKVNSIEEKLKN